MVTRDNNQMSDWLLYVKQVMLNSSRYVPINNGQTYLLQNLTAISNPNIVPSAFSIFWLCTFLLLLILLVTVLICQCICERKAAREMDSGIIRVIKPNSKIIFIKRTWKKVLICLVIISTMLCFIFLCLLAIEQSIASAKLSKTQTNNSTKNRYNSLNGAVNLSFVYLSNLYDVIAKDSVTFINGSVNNMSATITVSDVILLSD